MARQERPPEDGQDWISTKEATQLLDMNRSAVVRRARRCGWTMYQPQKGAWVWLLRGEVQSQADFLKLRSQWRAKHQQDAGERLTERIDPQQAREFLISAKEAASRLGVTLKIIYRMVVRGRLTSWQSKPGHPGSRLWFSPTQIARLLEDSDWLRRQARGRQAQLGWGVREPNAEGGNVPCRAAVVMSRCECKEYAEELLATQQVAAVMGVSRCKVHTLRRRGRLRGIKIWRRFKPLRYWYFYRKDVEALMASESYQMFRTRWREAHLRKFPSTQNTQTQTGDKRYVLGVRRYSGEMLGE